MTPAILTLAVAVLVASSYGSASAQPGNRRVDMESRVLDVVLPLDVQNEPYRWRMVLRFTDSASQLTLVARAGSRIEVTERRVVAMDNGRLAGLVTRSMEQNRSISERQIAAQLKVETVRRVIDADSISPLLEDLRRVTLSPILEDRGGTNFARYEFRYDTWQEAAHYTVLTPYGATPLDDLAAWMRKCRERVAALPLDLTK